MKYIIYCLRDPITKERRYVGKSSSGLRRPKAHAYPSALAADKNLHKVNWIRGLAASDLKYEIEVLEKFLDDSTLDHAESRWISDLRAQGCPLTNLLSGGKSLTAEDRERIAASKRGKPRPEAVKRKISAALKGRPLSDDTKAKMSKAAMGKPKTKQHAANIAAGKAGYVYSQDAVRNMTAGQRRRWTRPIVDENGVVYEGLWDVEQKLGIDRSRVWEVVTGRRKSALGHILRYSDS